MTDQQGPRNAKAVNPAVEAVLGYAPDEAVARMMASQASDRIHDLLDYGVPFDRDLEGRLQVTREAAHSESRIVRVRGDMAGRAWFRERVEESGLMFHQDGAANLYARLNWDEQTPSIMAGSHLDTVPGAGHLDDLMCDLRQDLLLRPRLVVLGQFTDRVEQLRTALVVEVLRRAHLPRPFEPFEDLGQLRYLFTHAATSFASRKPRNCQRASG